MMQRLVRNTALSISIGLVVGIIYFAFETSFVKAIELVWFDILNIKDNHWLIVPATILLTLLYFYVLKTLDPKPDKKESLLDLPPNPSVRKIFLILAIGFFSMLAGASLGPEAILFPASLIAGTLIGQHAQRQKDRDLLIMLGAPALFTAFFSSFLVGMLSVLLLVKMFKERLVELVIYSAVACLATLFVLAGIFNKEAFVSIPHVNALTWTTALGIIILFVFGMAATYWLRVSFKISDWIHDQLKTSWYVKALLAGTVLSGLYFFSNDLIMFTGNHSIEPMLSQASGLGVMGLLGIIVAKNMAIAWSRVAGYRGGMIFPTVFIAFTVVALGNQLGFKVDLTIGVISTLAGIFYAGRGTHIFE